MAVARGDEPADLVLSGGHVLSVFTKEWLDVDVAIQDGHIVGLGRYEGRERLDVSGAYLVPGFIDAHMHIESSKLMVDEFARAVLVHGTTTVVADPHEIANVLGTDGIHWLLDCCEDLPLDVFVMASSCVPASRFESPRRPLTTGDIESLLRRSRTIGIAEMMNFPGVINGSAEELAKLETGLTDHVDGHAPGVRGPALNAYISAGISTDHEAFTLEEALEKRRLGMWVLLREASIARNLRDLLPLVKSTAPSAAPSAPTTASRTSSSSTATSTRWSASRWRRGSAPRTRSSWRRSTRRPATACGGWAPSRPAIRRTSLS